MSLSVYRAELVNPSPADSERLYIVGADWADVAGQVMVQRPAWTDRRTSIELLGPVVGTSPLPLETAVAWFQIRHPDRHWGDLSAPTMATYEREATEWIAATERARGH